jgi:RHS repeat-associated protein
MKTQISRADQDKVKRATYLGRLLLPILTLILFSFAAPSYADTQTRTSAFDYDPVSGLLTKEIIEPDDPNLCLVTTYVYDAFGNKTSATTRNCNGSAGSVPASNTEAAAPAATITVNSTTIANPAIIVSRTSTTTYDTQGRFALSSTNALNQTETRTYSSTFGSLLTLTGPNGLTTSWTYDTFGRKLTESRADGTGSAQSYALCGTGGISCPTTTSGIAPVYAVTATQPGAPYKRSYYDTLDRAIQSETQDKDGGLIYSQTQYDHLSRTYRSSLPYKSTDSPVWTTVAYDAINRVTSTTSPDGSVSSIAYYGLTTVSTNAKNQARVEVKNTQGQLLRVTDANSQSINYQYDAYGNLTSTIDPLGNTTTLSYDKRGRKTAMNDPDQGIWAYAYDALGQLARQTDAKSQTVTFTYDKLGRMLTRAEPDLNSTWAYDTCDATLNPAGKCIGKPVKESTDNGYIRTYVYDAYGRPTAEVDNVDTGYGVAKSYDSYGRVLNVVYPGPNGITVTNGYSTTGYLTSVANASTGTVYWTANSMDAAGRVTQYTYGNSVANNLTYNPLNGRLTQTQSGSSGSINNQSYVYDALGNLTQRYDGVTGLNESFGYDNLNRLTGTTATSASITTSVSVTYNAIGNIITKSDIGTYTYGTTVGSTLIQPHAVTKIMMNDNVTVYGTYTYDANGNQTSGAGRTVNWNSWNMPTNITGTGTNTPSGTSSSTFAFVYNASHERVKETLPNGTIIYNISPRVDTGIHVEKRVKTDGTVEYAQSLYAGGFPFGTVTTVTTPAAVTTTSTRYYHTDHLGSIVAITDETGNVTSRRSYDAWGKQRNLNGTSMSNAFFTPIAQLGERHGFTGHEEMDDVGLIHMNGRIYDPATGRFLSADPTIQFPDDLQSYNRYSYINNNPLCTIDPSGYGLFGGLFKSIGHIISGVMSVLPSGLMLKNPTVRMIASAVAAYYTAGALYGAYMGSAITAAGGAMSITGAQFASASFTASILSGAGGGFVAGFVGSKGNLKDGFMGAVSGGAFGWAGTIGEASSIGRYAAHALAGCAGAAVGGGDCGQGAISAVAGKFATNISDGNPFAAVVAGGTVSVIGGGKFINGAKTATFGYMFNCGFSPGCWQAFLQRAQLVLQTLWVEYGPAATSLAADLGGVNGTLSVGTSYGKLGTVIENPGNLIKGIADNGHYLEAKFARGVTSSQVIDAVQQPLAVLQQSSGGYLYIGNNAAVVVNKAGELVTTYSSAQYDSRIQQVIFDAIGAKIPK